MYMNLKSILAIFTLSAASISSALASGNDGSTPSTGTLRASAAASTLSINSSSYNTAIGIRGIGTSGITIKHFTSSSRAFEGIIGFWPDAFSATLLVERYVNAFGEPGLNWYYGIGGHVAAQTNWTYYEGNRVYTRESGELGLGVDGIFGMEYKIREIPIAISFDLKPFVEVTTSGNAYLALDPGLGVKLAF